MLNEVSNTVKTTAAIIFASAVTFLASCKKDNTTTPNVNPVDPTATKIEKLQADSAAQAKDLYVAVDSAKTSPNDITVAFNVNFITEAENLSIKPANLKDSAKVFINTAKAINDFGTGINEANLNKLADKSNTYIATVAELSNLKKSR